MRLSTVTAVLLLLFTAWALPAQARSHYHHHHYAKHYSHHHYRYASYDSGSVVSHPSGCPWHAFCGCGASVRIFGHPVRNLFLAANWFGFPRAAPAPGMAAVRRHHVFIIEAVLGGGVVRAYDANSGGHLTRVHNISLAGYTVVNPGGGRYGRRSHLAGV